MAASVSHPISRRMRDWSGTSEDVPLRGRTEALRHEHVERLDAVAPSDLLALTAAARLEAHRQLGHVVPRAQEAGGDLRLDVEAVGLEAQRARHVGPHDLVARLHIGE